MNKKTPQARLRAYLATTEYSLRADGPAFEIWKHRQYVCLLAYSLTLGKWAATHNMVPNDTDEGHYRFEKPGQAIAWHLSTVCQDGDPTSAQRPWQGAIIIS